jgi:hypothetical protein
MLFSLPRLSILLPSVISVIRHSFYVGRKRVEPTLSTLLRWFRGLFLRFKIRFSFYLSGGHRPPFSLCLLKRNCRAWHAFRFYKKPKDIHPGLCFSIEQRQQNKSHSKEKEFQSPSVRRRLGFDSIPPFSKNHSEEYSFFLWPDSLRWNYWFFALAFMIVAGMATWIAKIPSFFYVITIPLFTIIAPIVTFSFFRSPVLSELWKGWPTKQMDGWLEGVVAYGKYGQFDVWKTRQHSNISYGKETLKRLWMEYAVRCLPPLETPTASSWFMPSGSPQESMIRAALITSFQRERHRSAFQGAVFKALFYWLVPVWTGLIYLVLFWLYLAIPIMAGRYHGTAPFITYFLLIILWLVMSIIYITCIVKCREKWIDFTAKDLLYLPPSLRLLYSNHGNYLVDITSPESIAKLLSILTFIATAILIALGGLLIPLSPPAEDIVDAFNYSKILVN